MTRAARRTFLASVTLAHPVLFVFALLLLWLPRRSMRMGRALWQRKRHRRTQEPWKRREPGDPRLSFGEEFRKVRNWFDLLRAAAGSLAIFGGHGIEPSLAAAEGRPAGVQLLAIQYVVIAIGVLIQVVRRERGRVTFFASTFYLAGAAVGMCGVWGVVFAFVLAWALNPMLPSAATFLLVQGVALAVFGVLLRGTGDIRPVLAGLNCVAPALLGVMTRRPLTVFTRKGTPGGAGP